MKLEGAGQDLTGAISVWVPQATGTDASSVSYCYSDSVYRVVPQSNGLKQQSYLLTDASLGGWLSADLT